MSWNIKEKKSVQKIQVPLKYASNIGYLT